jgi:hypothetical protein
MPFMASNGGVEGKWWGRSLAWSDDSSHPWSGVTTAFAAPMSWGLVLGATAMLGLMGCAGGGPSLPDRPMLAGSSEGGTGGGPTSAASATGMVSTTSGASATGMIDAETGVVDSSGSSGSNESSSGEPPQEDCENNVDFCDTWFLRPGTNVWEARRLDPDSPHAPRATVVAAFDIEQTGVGYVLTADTYHELDLGNEQWMAAGPLVDIMQEAQQYGSLRSAFSQPGDSIYDQAMVLVAADGHWESYGYTILGNSFTHLMEGFIDDPPGTGWSGPNAPPVNEVTALWLDMENSQGWVMGNVLALCGAGDLLSSHMMVLSANEAHTVEVGWCFDFFPPTPIDQYPPFTYPLAPPPADIGAGLYNEAEGLWIFRG